MAHDTSIVTISGEQLGPAKLEVSASNHHMSFGVVVDG